MYVVIRAGGVGTRLWPVSRSQKPKQLHALTGTNTLLQDSVDRVRAIVQPEQIYVSCNRETEATIRAELKDISPDNIIIEPAMRDTAAAVGLETLIIAKQHPDAVIASLGSDHVIVDNQEFQRVLQLAEDVITQNPESILCIGVKPHHPDIGYGYIELGKAISNEVFEVTSFKEKPTEEVAQRFIDAGNYLWNTNMFVWRADTLLNLYKHYQPAMYDQLMRIDQEPESINELYPQLEKIAIDYAIIERAEHILAIPGTFGWNDIGDWARLKDEMSSSPQDNYAKADHLDVDSENILVYSDSSRLIATIGLHDVIIVDTEDALLVCHKSRSQDVKSIVERLKKDKRDQLL